MDKGVGRRETYIATTTVIFIYSRNNWIFTTTIAYLLSVESARLWSNNFTNIPIRSSQNPKSLGSAYTTQNLNLKEGGLGLESV